MLITQAFFKFIYLNIIRNNFNNLISKRPVNHILEMPVQSLYILEKNYNEQTTK